MRPAEISRSDRYKPLFLEGFEGLQRGGELFASCGHWTSFLAYCAVSLLAYNVEGVLAFPAKPP